MTDQNRTEETIAGPIPARTQPHDPVPGQVHGPVPDEAADRAAEPTADTPHAQRPEQSEPPVDVKQTMVDQLGGTSGMLYSIAPVVVFATAVAFVPLAISIGVSIAVAVVLAVFRMWRGEPFSAAIGGVIGVVAAGGVSAWTGSANDFFVIGIWAAFAAGAVTLASQVLRRPVTGIIWNALHGGTHAWREDRPTLLAHDLATAAVTVMFAARFIVQEWLYVAGTTGWLAVSDIVLGVPLTALVAVVVIWAFRRSTKRLIKNTKDTAPAATTTQD